MGLLQRYLDCWLPLVYMYPSNELLIPPADVAWIWHCHRLAPKIYEAFVIGRFGTLLEATTPFALQHGDAENVSQDCLLTQRLWEK